MCLRSFFRGWTISVEDIARARFIAKTLMQKRNTMCVTRFVQTWMILRRSEQHNKGTIVSFAFYSLHDARDARLTLKLQSPLPDLSESMRSRLSSRHAVRSWRSEILKNRRIHVFEDRVGIVIAIAVKTSLMRGMLWTWQVNFRNLAAHSLLYGVQTTFVFGRKYCDTLIS